MRTELYMEGHRLDLTGDLPVELSYVIDDIKSFGDKNSPYSLPVTLPATSLNNRAFGHCFDFGSSNFANDGTFPNYGYYFDASQTARVVVYQDSVQVFKGVLRLVQLIDNNGAQSYDCNLTGELGGLMAAIGAGLVTGNKDGINDLDFSEYNLEWTVSNISLSVYNTTGTGVIFPLIDYGNVSYAKHDYEMNAFRPALFAREYVAKIIQKAGYTYSSDFLDGTFMKKVIIPHNQDVLYTQGDGALTVAGDSTEFFTVPSVPSLVRFDTFNSAAFTANTNNDTFTSTVATPYVGVANASILVQSYGHRLYTVYLYLNGAAVASYPSYSPTGPGVVNHTLYVNYGFLISAGDTISLAISADGSQPFRAYARSFTVTTQDLIKVAAQPGDLLYINESLPGNTSQRDLLLSIIKAFNLYVTEDRDTEKMLHLTPYPYFYETGSAEDWSNKLDRKLTITQKPLSEWNGRYFNFLYDADSDYWNALYKKRWSQAYGDFLFDTQYRFTADKKEVKLIFSGSPLVSYVGEDKAVTPLYSRDNSEKEGRISTKLRLLQFKLRTVGVYNIYQLGDELTGYISATQDSTAVIGFSGSTHFTTEIAGGDWLYTRDGDFIGVVDTVSSDTLLSLVDNSLASVTNVHARKAAPVVSTNIHGYAGHLDDPLNPTQDLNFGAPYELYSSLAMGAPYPSVNLFNSFYSQYLAEIVDKDSKLLIGSFRLTELDIYRLSFSKFKIVDGTLYRLNKVTNWIPGHSTQTELLRVIDIPHA